LIKLSPRSDALTLGNTANFNEVGITQSALCDVAIHTVAGQVELGHQSQSQLLVSLLAVLTQLPFDGRDLGLVGGDQIFQCLYHVQVP